MRENFVVTVAKYVVESIMLFLVNIYLLTVNNG